MFPRLWNGARFTDAAREKQVPNAAKKRKGKPPRAPYGVQHDQAKGLVMTPIASVSVVFALLGAAVAYAGERREAEREAEADRFVFFSGGVPALELRATRDGFLCPLEAAERGVKSKKSKAIFAAY
jgi:hypothetical protein